MAEIYFKTTNFITNLDDFTPIVDGVKDLEDTFTKKNKHADDCYK